MDTKNLSNIKCNITGKALLEAISNQIYIEHELKHVLVVKPTFSKYTEVDEICKRLIKIKVPYGEAWTYVIIRRNKTKMIEVTMKI